VIVIGGNLLFLSLTVVFLLEKRRSKRNKIQLGGMPFESP
jgi:hypothetical protein